MERGATLARLQHELADRCGPADERAQRRVVLVGALGVRACERCDVADARDGCDMSAAAGAEIVVGEQDRRGRTDDAREPTHEAAPSRIELDDRAGLATGVEHGARAPHA